MVISTASLSEVFSDETQIRTQVNPNRSVQYSGLQLLSGLVYSTWEMSKGTFFIVHFQSRHNEKKFEESGLIFNIALLR